MKLRKTPIAMAVAGAVLLSGAALATQEIITLYTVEPVVVVEEIAIVESVPAPMFVAAADDALGGFEWVLGPELSTYYLTVSKDLMPNPTVPSESNSWGE